MKLRQILNLLSILALFVWGGLFIYLYASGRISGENGGLKMVTKQFQMFALIAGMGLCVLAAFNLLTLQRKSGCGHDHDHAGHDHDHDHETPSSNLIAAVVILIVPVLIAARVSPDRFSGEYNQKWGNIERKIMQMKLAERRAAKRERAAQTAKSQVSVVPIDQPEGTAGVDSPPNPTAGETSTAGAPTDSPPETSEGGDEWGEFTMEDLKRMVPQNSEGSFLLDVPQLFYTAGDDELMNVMEGIPVETVAQVMPETINNPDGTRLRIFRLFIECCAADARPLSIPVEFGKEPPEYEEMGWVKVVGKMHYSEEGEEIIPIINVETMEPTAEPVDMMMY